MYGKILKRGELMSSLKYLNDTCENGDKVYTEEGNLLVAKKVNGEVLLVNQYCPLSLKTECKVIKHNICKKEIEIGDLLYLRNGSILRAIVKNEKEENGAIFSLEVVVAKGIRASFNQVPFLWRDSFYYGVTGLLDVVKVKKLDGSIEKTDMWYKHFYENRRKLAKVTLLVEPEKVIVDADIISFYNANGFLNVCADDLGEYINVYGYNIEEYETISIDAVEDYFNMEEN